jgi:hypothetical protein
MAKMPEQSFENDAPLIKLAYAWTRLSSDDDWDAAPYPLGKYRQTMAKCLVDGSILGWIATGPGEGNRRARRERDLAAFGDLVRLAGLKLISISLPKTVVDEMAKAKYLPEATTRIQAAITSSRMKIQTEAIKWTIGQRPYGTFHNLQGADDTSPGEWLQKLLEPDKATGIPPTDYDHYLMACLSDKPFLTMDYKLAEALVKALRREVEIVEGPKERIPKNRPPLKVPVVTPSVYLNQLLAVNPDWRGQLDLARLEDDSRLCQDLRNQYAAVGYRLVELLEGGDRTSAESIELRAEWERLEEELLSGHCQLGFFDRLPPELKPTRWKELDRPSTDETA